MAGNRRSGQLARRGRGRGMGGPVAVYPIGWWIAGQLIAAVFRFLAGQVVLRRPGRFDARYMTWAATPPDNAELTRTEGIPRTRWARRPGWHRQVTRLGAIALLVGLLAWPTVTLAVTVAAIAVVGVRKALELRELAYYRRVCGSFLAWTAGRVGWADLDPDPRAWIELPAGGIAWEPVAPLRAALVQAGDQAERDGWLARRAPRLAQRLTPLVAPVAEWRWVLWLTEPREGRRPLVALLWARIGAVVVWIGEASRRVRVRPRLVTGDLSNPDATITVHYPATYQAHGADLSEIERVVTSRMPDGPWKFRHNADDLTVTIFHPSTLPRKVEWDRRVFGRFSQLEIPIGERAEGKVVTVNLKGQTPHINGSGKTGWGKTVNFLTIIGGFLYHGGHVLVVDPKRIDFVRPFRRLANVDLVTVPERFPGALSDVAEEMERRYQIIEEFTERADELGLPPMEQNAELYFQPLMFATDEKSAFAAICKAWWKREGNDGKPGKGDPITYDWERAIVARGRQCCVFAMCAAQQNAIPNVFPDTDIRSNYQYKILSGPADTPSWVVTFPGERRRKLSSTVKGRAIVGVGSELFEAQLAYIDPTEIREAAIHGLELREQLNRERAERLAMISGRPLWEVSPLPFWVPTPAEMPESVPGQPTTMDSDDDAAPAVIDGTATVTVLPSGNVHESPVETDDRDDVEIAEEVTAVATDISSVATDANESSNSDMDQESNGRSHVGQVGDPFAVPAGPAGRVRGNKAAAEYLGCSFDAFRKARTRAEKNGDGIPGMEMEGRFVTFEPDQLAEWWNQRPGTGRKAS